MQVFDIGRLFGVVFCLTVTLLCSGCATGGLHVYCPVTETAGDTRYLVAVPTQSVIAKATRAILRQFPQVKTDELEFHQLQYCNRYDPEQDKMVESIVLIFLLPEEMSSFQRRGRTHYGGKAIELKMTRRGRIRKDTIKKIHMAFSVEDSNES